ncbi:protein of unknown function (plasmid) [Thermococcus nautili]|nr:protein of unknown function [Thermococcus nautili]
MLSISISIYPPRKSPIFIQYSTSVTLEELFRDLEHRFEITGYSLINVRIKGPKGQRILRPRAYKTEFRKELIEQGLPVLITGVLRGEKGDLVISILISPIAQRETPTITNPCKDCPYREQFRCTLLNLPFSLNDGPKKCYARYPPTYEEFLQDIIEAIEQPVKSKSLAKRLGMTPNVATRILQTLSKHGFLEAKKNSTSPAIYFPIKRPSVEELRPILKSYYLRTHIKVIRNE